MDPNVFLELVALIGKETGEIEVGFHEDQRLGAGLVLRVGVATWEETLLLGEARFLNAVRPALEMVPRADGWQRGEGITGSHGIRDNFTVAGQAPFVEARIAGVELGFLQELARLVEQGEKERRRQAELNDSFRQLVDLEVGEDQVYAAMMTRLVGLDLEEDRLEARIAGKRRMDRILERHQLHQVRRERAMVRRARDARGAALRAEREPLRDAYLYVADDEQVGVQEREL